jgi:hypothetical protein
LVRKGNMQTGETAPWELYDMVADRSEMHDLAGQQPERVAELAAKWEAWAVRAHVKPWPWGSQTRKKQRSAKKSFSLKTGDELDETKAPNITDRAFEIEAAIVQPGDGVIVAQGGYSLGYSLYVVDEKPVFATRHKGKLTLIAGDQTLPAGSSTIGVSLAKDGAVVMQVNGKQVATGKTPGTIRIPIDGLTVGRDGGDPVSQYAGPNAFQGEIASVQIRLSE